MTSRAPAWRAWWSVCSVTSAVIATMGIVAVRGSARSRPISSWPPMTGIIRSVVAGPLHRDGERRRPVDPERPRGAVDLVMPVAEIAELGLVRQARSVNLGRRRLQPDRAVGARGE